MNRERQEVKSLFDKLCAQPKRSFPQYRQPLDAPSKPGVYIIRKEESVLHVGRTLRGRDGIHQRLKNHLHGSSSFTNEYLKGKGATLRKDCYTYQYLELEDPRKRALLEAYAVGTLCPKHIGLGE
jgi:excinuclease UvrABC nuclease subunit